MPLPWIPPYANFYPYSPWDRYDSSGNLPSYFRPSHKDHAASKRPTFNKQPYVKDCFTPKESVRSTRKNKEVVEQVYHIKKDGRKCATSDLILKDKEPIKVLTLATKDNEMSQSSAKSKENKLKVHKVKQEFPLLQTKSQPGCPLGLSYWRKKELQKLSAQELKKKNMAWVPKRINQKKNDVQPSIATSVTKVKKGKDGSEKN